VIRPRFDGDFGSNQKGKYFNSSALNDSRVDLDSIQSPDCRPHFHIDATYCRRYIT